MILLYVRTISPLPVLCKNSHGSEHVGQWKGYVYWLLSSQASGPLSTPPRCLLSVLFMLVWMAQKAQPRGPPPTTLAHRAGNDLLMEGRNEGTTWYQKIYILVLIMPLVCCVTLSNTPNIAGNHFLFYLMNSLKDVFRKFHQSPQLCPLITIFRFIS